MDIQWVLKTVASLAWIYFIYVFTTYIFASFSVKYYPDNPEKTKSNFPLLVFFAGVAFFSIYFIEPDAFGGYLPYLILIFSPLFIWDGILPLLRKRNIVFGGNSIFKQESFLRRIPFKSVSRIDRKQNSIVFQDAESMVPILIFHKRNYSDKEWIDLNTFVSKKYGKKVLDFTIKK